ncbi:putative 4-hydroxy-4-methyl-2-oxoglutarate aldolase [Vibrio profundum]|uniref:putative 4-hydroxy-4-methyl-2-oxoglutarate aldolase n=1 Tax=Vibrio profundum TaxID=2910247 RepID=UPI003D151C15
MNDITPDICDQHGSKVTVLSLPLSSFGKKRAFWGKIATVRCYHDNSKVRQVLSQPGKGKVLFVDGHGSSQRALLGDEVAALAVKNGWEGVIIYGAIRDVAVIGTMNIAVQALGTCPMKTDKRDVGDVDVSLTINNQLIAPGDYLYADDNGILLSSEKLL